MRKKKRGRKSGAVFPLKELLARKGWSQRQLARTLKMDYNRVNDLANARHLPGWETVVRIATAVEADLGDFAPPAPEPQPEPRPAAKRPKRKPVVKLVPVTEGGEG